MGKKTRTQKATPATRRAAPHDTAPTHATRIGATLLTTGVVASIIVVPLSMSPWGMNQFGPAKLLALSIAAAFISAGIALRAEQIAPLLRALRSSRLGWALAAYMGVAALSTITSVDRFHSIVGSYPEYQGALTLALWTVVALGASLSFAAEHGPSTISRSFVIALAAVAAVAWLQKLGVPTLGDQGGWSARAWSTVGNPSHLGVWLVAALPFSAERAYADASRQWRLAASAAGILGVGALAFSGSRGALLGLAVSAVAGAVLVMRGRPLAEKTRISLLGGALVTSAAAVALLTQTRFTRLSGFFDIAGGSAGWRPVVWRTALRIAGDRPFLGWGLNSMRFVYPTYRSAGALDSPVRMGTVADMHNLVLNTAASAGYAGVVAILACVALVAQIAWRTGQRGAPEWTGAAAASIALAGFLTAVSFHYPALDSGAAVSVALGILLAADASVATRAVAAQPPAGKSAAPRSRGVRLVATALAVLLSAAVIAAGALVAADAAAARALGLAGSGAPWSATRTLLIRAQSLAPWELAYRKAWASAAISSMRPDNAPTVVAEASAALDAASRIAPLDSSVMGGRGDLALQAAKTGSRESNLAAAERAYLTALELDPNNAVYLAGVGTVQHARGEFDAAVTTFERVVKLAPDSADMWDAMSQAYQSAGRPRDAQTAQAKAQGLARR